MGKFTLEQRLELLKKAREAKADKYIAKLEDKLANPAKMGRPKKVKEEIKQDEPQEDVEIVEETVYEKIKKPKKKIIRKIIQQYESASEEEEEIVYMPPKPQKRQQQYEQYARPDIKQEKQEEPKRNIFFNF